MKILLISSELNGDSKNPGNYLDHLIKTNKELPESLRGYWTFRKHLIDEKDLEEINKRGVQFDRVTREGSNDIFYIVS